MRASIVIPACNEGEYLTRTIEACLETLDGLDSELVVADDASTDGSVEKVAQRFPIVRTTRHDQRLGMSSAKASGARMAQGAVLVFLDAHTKPEPGAILRLVERVERLRGRAILTPAVVALDEGSRENDPGQVVHGYGVDLQQFDCRRLALEQLRRADGEPLYESPALMGCAFAISADLYQQLWGFDAHMRSWGSEDLDLGMKAWLLGCPVLHDPDAVVGHRFRTSVASDAIPVEDLLVSRFRFARKHFTHAVWDTWLAAIRRNTVGQTDGHPEGVWARAWHQFEASRASAEQERAFLQGRRVHDEFWYAERFGLAWPHLSAASPSGGAGLAQAGAHAEAAAVGESPAAHLAPSVSPSPPPCTLTGLTPASATVVVGQQQQFVAQGSGLASVAWSAPGGAPASGTGPTFATHWNAAASRKVTAACGGRTRSANITVVKPQVVLVVPHSIVHLLQTQTLQAVVTPTTVHPTSCKFEMKRHTEVTWKLLRTVPGTTVPFPAKIAGHFDLRVTAIIGGQPFVSAVQTLEVQFPSFSDIVADATVQTFTDSAWQDTLNATTATTRREEGFWVQLDTDTGRFSHTATILGPTVGPTQTGSVQLGARPADSPATIDITKTARYTVASFHTHTPTAFRPVGRPVGPSGADNAADTADDVTGIVYDYIESPAGSGAIPAGHPLHDPAQRYHSGPLRRKTPP